MDFVPASLLLLADARLPAGGHVHSGGLEAAWRAGAVSDVATLERFLAGRLASVGRVTAAFAAAAARLASSAEGATPRPWISLDAELDARTPSPAQRAASRQQGRGLLRLLAAPSPSLSPTPSPTPSPAAAVIAALREACQAGPHHALVFGAAAAASGAGDRDVATATALAAVTGPASAAVRLLGLDPIGVHALLTRMAPEVDEVAAAAAAPLPPEELPDDAAPLLDILAESHPHLEGQLFVS
jgi:urease accessory protein